MLTGFQEPAPVKLVHQVSTAVPETEVTTSRTDEVVVELCEALGEREGDTIRVRALDTLLLGTTRNHMYCKPAPHSIANYMYIEEKYIQVLVQQ